MNNYTLQGKILAREFPKEPGRSCLMVIAVGRLKEEHAGVIQTVNKVIVRVPPKLTHVAATFQDGDYVEITGNLSGRAHQSIPNGNMVASVNLIATTMQICDVSHMVDLANVDRLLSCTWQGTGLVKQIKAPKQEGRPATLFVQIERPIVRTDALKQPTAVLPITVYENAFEKLKNIEPQMTVFVQGHVHGVLRQMPVPGIDGETEQSLEVGLVLRHIEQCSITPRKLYETREQQQTRQLNEKHAARDAARDTAFEN